MAIESLFNRLESIHRLNDGLKDFLASRTSLEFYKKNAVIYQQGEKLQKVYFIVSGLVVGETFMEDRNHVCWFSKESNFIEDHSSFLYHQPAVCKAIAAEDSVLLSLQYRDLDKLYHFYPEMNFIARCLLKHCHTYNNKRTELLMILHCRNRYQRFKKDFPWADERLKRAWIASYLNMSAETLSRLVKGG